MPLPVLRTPSDSFTGGIAGSKSGGIRSRLILMDNPKRVLIIQLKRAGDVIVTIPVLSALRQALPETEIDFLVDKPFAPLIEQNPNVNKIQTFDRRSLWATWRALRTARYDWII